VAKTRRALTPLFRQIHQRAVRCQHQRFGRTVLYAGGPLFATAAQIAFMRRRFDSALLYRRQDDLHHAKRAGNHTGFTADAFLLINLDAVVKLADGAIGTTAGARRPSQWWQVTALRFCSFLITVMRGKKRCGVKTCCSSLCAMTQATSQALHPMHL
jgi:hypothetical protein